MPVEFVHRYSSEFTKRLLASSKCVQKNLYAQKITCSSNTSVWNCKQCELSLVKLLFCARSTYLHWFWGGFLPVFSYKISCHSGQLSSIVLIHLYQEIMEGMSLNEVDISYKAYLHPSTLVLFPVLIYMCMKYYFVK